MPSNNQSIHPSNKDLQITFTEENHLYIDSNKKKYMSVTTLIGKAFPEFDSEKVAEQCAIKRGVSKDDLLKEWAEKGEKARFYGTRMHENIEHYINHEYDLMYTPDDIKEKIMFDGSIRIIDSIIKKYHPVLLEPEKLIFSPAFGIAGSVDLLIKVNDLEYIIIDWKRLSKDLEKESFGNKCGHILPTLNIPDSNYWHYTLQLQIYENILKSENYIDVNAQVKKTLIAWNGQKFKLEKVPYIAEAWALMAWRNKF